LEADEGFDPRLVDVAGLEDARADQLSFLANRKYHRLLATSAAGVVLVGIDTVSAGRAVIRCPDPYLAFAQALLLFHPQDAPEPGVHPLAFVGEGADVAGATLDAFAWVGAGARVGAGSWLQAHSSVGAGAVVGRDCRLMSGSVVAADCTVGDRVWLNPGAVVGGEGFGFAPTRDGNIKIPQVGRAVVEDDVEIGANSTVDRAALGETRVRRGAKLDNLVQVGHAAEIGEDCLLVAFSGVAGSSRLGRRVTLAAKAAVLGHLEIGDGVQVGVHSAVHDNQPAGARVTGAPAIDHRRWLRAATAFGDLPDQARELRRLRQQVDALQARLDASPPPVAPPPSRPSPEVPAMSTLVTPNGVVIEARQILDLLPHRYPFLMIDRVLECEPGVRAVAVKCVSINEPQFQGHFPGRPILPGVLLVEAFAQVAGIVALTAHPDHAGKAVYLLGLDSIRFRKPVLPGDRVIITCEKVFERRGVWKFAARADVDGKKVADGQVMATVADREPA
jgi:UDP-3-O-[3-hydroxymyristoyl] glucosamine N-acyltransferase